MQFTPLILVLSAFVAVNTSPVPNNGLAVSRDISSNIAYDLERRQKKAGAGKGPGAGAAAGAGAGAGAAGAGAAKAAGVSLTLL